MSNFKSKSSTIESQAKEIRITGIVQGVGFRPFIYNLAKNLNIKGYVLNDSLGVLIRAEAEIYNIEEFIKQIKEKLPPQARIDKLKTKLMSIEGFSDFIIKESLQGLESQVLISPDISTCKDCQRELKTPKDYRFSYPFINCTNCGPRFTIIEDVPYDRINTSMNVFKMCDICQSEYEDPSNRRFHAQPNACSKCGPRLILLDSKARKMKTSDIIKKTAEFLKKGKIIAIKGLGGYHLACDALNEKAVSKLRQRKYREDKPFALMARNLDQIKEFCQVSSTEAEILSSWKRPILLLRKKENISIADSIAPRQKYLGFVLPYNPFHHLLFSEIDFPIVSTSGNVSDEPIAFQDPEALERLKGIADFFLIYNREIYTRCDDSVARVFRGKLMLLRRARGFTPEPLDIKCNFNKNILATGAEEKNTFAIGKNSEIIISHHIGDLENMETLKAYQKATEHFKKLFYFTPEVVAFDLHPAYLATQYAQELKNVQRIGVQHHHAHIASCIAENNLTEKVIGVALDGTGFGIDGKLWGSEFMVADLKDFERFAHFSYIQLPGASLAIKEPERIAIAYLYKVFGDKIFELRLPLLKEIDKAKLENIIKMIKQNINSPLSCGMGRLFDGVSALLGIRKRINYQGQAAIELEMETLEDVEEVYNYKIDTSKKPWIIEPDKIILSIAEDILSKADQPIAENKNKSAGYIASVFHNTLVKIITEVCQKINKITNLRKVVLSGGVFQNMYLLKRIVAQLEKSGFEVYTHSMVPPNDGGIALGQLVIANEIVNSQ